ncbi:hypothetical protein WICPIJ_004733 [Wickerhamomyces pijperi]|uniref:NAD-dependent epimerase/dehydratase domain-containing protein n=1 Tax=Wickerhamomyces pijperi TaxID=599730 RepID=A0A9P8Q557_WICPI|nr:hypothetical protein WICPIJ_004733 [Wickerhamomyces pijperi]
MSSTKTVFLTGASGFIALHITGVLLSKGYNVVGTVRSQSKADNIIKNFKKEYPDIDSRLVFEIVPDISEPTAFDSALQAHPEIQFVLHTASPFSFGLDQPLDQAYLIPATQGTKNVLTAIQRFAPQVTKVVITSSFAAMINGDKSGDSSFVHTEDTWNPITWADVQNEGDAYFASKTLAEKLAREFVITETPNFTVTSVNPPYVLGPQRFTDTLANKTLNTSAEYINGLLDLPRDYSSQSLDPRGVCVDVRDVALLHVLALENDKLQGLRLFPASAHFNLQVLLNLAHEQIPELSNLIGKGIPEGAEHSANVDNLYYDTSKTLNATGISQWIPLETTVKDSVTQILNYRKEHNI